MRYVSAPCNSNHYRLLSAILEKRMDRICHFMEGGEFAETLSNSAMPVTVVGLFVGPRLVVPTKTVMEVERFSIDCPPAGMSSIWIGGYKMSGMDVIFSSRPAIDRTAGYCFGKSTEQPRSQCDKDLQRPEVVRRRIFNLSIMTHENTIAGRKAI